MAFPCLLCHGNILETLDVPSEVGGGWICCVCHDAAVNIEIEHYSVTAFEMATVVDISTSDEGEEDSPNLCVDCGIVLNQYCCSLEHNYCCACHLIYAGTSDDERTGSSEDDIGSSTEAPPDNEECLEEDIDATSDYNRSEELFSVEGLLPDHEQSLCPDDEDEVKSIQESQQDHDEFEPTLKRSRH
jgi:hypothetical protein